MNPDLLKPLHKLMTDGVPELLSSALSDDWWNSPDLCSLIQDLTTLQDAAHDSRESTLSAFCMLLCDAGDAMLHTTPDSFVVDRLRHGTEFLLTMIDSLADGSIMPDPPADLCHRLHVSNLFNAEPDEDGQDSMDESASADAGQQEQPAQQADAPEPADSAAEPDPPAATEAEATEPDPPAEPAAEPEPVESAEAATEQQGPDATPDAPAADAVLADGGDAPAADAQPAADPPPDSEPEQDAEAPAAPAADVEIAAASASELEEMASGLPVLDMDMVAGDLPQDEAATAKEADAADADAPAVMPDPEPAAEPTVEAMEELAAEQPAPDIAADMDIPAELDAAAEGQAPDLTENSDAPDIAVPETPDELEVPDEPDAVAEPDAPEVLDAAEPMAAEDSEPPAADAPGGDAVPADAEDAALADDGDAPAADDAPADADALVASDEPDADALATCTPATDETAADDAAKDGDAPVAAPAAEADEHTEIPLTDPQTEPFEDAALADAAGQFAEPDAATTEDSALQKEQSEALEHLFGDADGQDDDSLGSIEIDMDAMVADAANAPAPMPDPDPEPDLPEPEIPAAAEAEPEAVAEPEVMVEPDVEPEPEPEPETAEEPEPEAVAEADASGFDAEILETFLEEADDLVNELGQSLQDWRENPDNKDSISDVRRALHTLKGGARMTGMTSLGSMSHSFESFALAAGPDTADDAFFKEALGRVDDLATELERVRSTVGGGVSAEPDEAQPAADATPAADAADITDAADATPADATDDQPEQSAPPDMAIAPPADQEPAPPPQPAAPAAPQRQEFSRVPSGSLDKLIDLSNEELVLGGRVESKLGDVDSVLGELDITIGRIQNFIRKVDSETEAQITYRRHQISESSEGDSTFDPLEMDRYTSIQHLSRQLLESLSDLVDLQRVMTRRSSEMSLVLNQHRRLAGQVNSMLLVTRVVPFSLTLTRLERMVRQTARTLSKDVEVRSQSIDGGIDRQILEPLQPVLEHLLNNAVAHGIEPPDERAAAGKPAAGNVQIQVRRDGAMFCIEVVDDGRGIDLAAIKRRILEKRLLTDSALSLLNDREVMQYIFMPGFSTAGSLTEVAGRGIGMDVVQANIQRLDGKIDIDSIPGRGTRFIINVPANRAINRIMLVKLSKGIYGLPLGRLQSIIRMDKKRLVNMYNEQDSTLDHNGIKYKLAYLGDIVGDSTEGSLSIGDIGDDSTVWVILLHSGEYRTAVFSDQVVGGQDLILRALEKPFREVPGTLGIITMPDGQAISVIDVHALAVRYWTQGAESQSVIESQAQSARRSIPTIMVVDDSVTVRKITSRLLEQNHFYVETARDGLEALSNIDRIDPDLVLLDIEMPRMNGLELLSVLRSKEEYANLPVVFITSRTGEKHRAKGAELGVQHYIGKPYREDELIALIRDLLPTHGAREAAS